MLSTRRVKMTTGQLISHVHTLYYHNNYVYPSVDITNIWADFGSKTFAIADITSVSMSEIPPNKLMGIVGVELLVGGLLGGAIIALAFPSVVCDTIAGLVILLFVCLGIWVTSTTKSKYVVKISTASGVSKAFTSTNRVYTKDIVVAINKAIKERD